MSTSSKSFKYIIQNIDINVLFSYNSCISFASSCTSVKYHPFAPIFIFLSISFKVTFSCPKPTLLSTQTFYRFVFNENIDFLYQILFARVVWMMLTTQHLGKVIIVIVIIIIHNHHILISPIQTHQSAPYSYLKFITFIMSMYY